MRLRAYPYDAVSTSIANVDCAVTAGSTSVPNAWRSSEAAMPSDCGASGAGAAAPPPAAPPPAAPPPVATWGAPGRELDELLLGAEQPASARPAMAISAAAVRGIDVMPVRRGTRPRGARRDPDATEL